VLVLFPVSSCTVVVTPGSGLMGVGGTPEPESPTEPPHATSTAIGPAKTATPSGIVNPLNLMARAPRELRQATVCARWILPQAPDYTGQRLSIPANFDADIDNGV